MHVWCSAILSAVSEQPRDTAEQTAAARAVGTTVSVKDLFKQLPVRYNTFQRTLKREYQHLVNILQAYALISTGVRFIATNQVLCLALTGRSLILF